ncbi:Nucleoid-associated protein YbaB [Candidatus Kinetoplastibacterium sorsogonicusi]|uniref:Nucleoid-associated protein CKSOR_00140 n=2 Tax=Candidatus Kinetoplastidibacterium kentomonadis TaxID=1576550 RepID=A0A3S7J9D1_9PROT|nr:Nucleoid-associated protein YbaB [Candidatus Kinetoplastibacterium sorsogonicusi]
MKNQIAGFMKQAQQMQDNLQKAKDDLSNLQVEGISGGGLIKTIISCNYDVKKIEIDESLLNEDKDILEDLIVASLNDALKKVELKSQEKMSSITGGLPIPPGFKFPF